MHLKHKKTNSKNWDLS